MLHWNFSNIPSHGIHRFPACHVVRACFLLENHRISGPSLGTLKKFQCSSDVLWKNIIVQYYFLDKCFGYLLWFEVYANHLVLKVQNHSQLRKFFAKKNFFSHIWTQHQKLEIGCTNPSLFIPSYHQTWEFWILANLDSASKVGNWFHQPPQSHQQAWEFWILANLDSASKVGNWFHQPPQSHHHGNFGF